MAIKESATLKTAVIMTAVIIETWLIGSPANKQSAISSENKLTKEHVMSRRYAHAWVATDLAIKYGEVYLK